MILYTRLEIHEFIKQSILIFPSMYFFLQYIVCIINYCTNLNHEGIIKSFFKSWYLNNLIYYTLFLSK